MMMTNDGKKERHRRANNAFFRIKKTQKLCFLFLFFFTYRNQRGILSAPSISCGSYRRKSREINTSEQCLCPELFHNRGRNRNRRAGTTGFFFKSFFFSSPNFTGLTLREAQIKRKLFFLFCICLLSVCRLFHSYDGRGAFYVFFSWAGLNGTTGTAHIYTRQDRIHIHTHILFHHQKIMKIEIYTIYTHKYRQPASGKRERERETMHSVGCNTGQHGGETWG